MTMVPAIPHDSLERTRHALDSTAMADVGTATAALLAAIRGDTDAHTPHAVLNAVGMRTRALRTALEAMAAQMHALAAHDLRSVIPALDALESLTAAHAGDSARLDLALAAAPEGLVVPGEVAETATRAVRALHATLFDLLVAYMPDALDASGADEIAAMGRDAGT